MRARFDRFTVDLNSGELSRDEGSCARIQQKPLQVLRLLLDAEGKVVTRDQLRGALWPGETFVDFEHGINTAVKKLRQVLEDSIENPKFVETLPKVGYRFLAPVEWVTDSDGMYHPRAVPAISSDRALLPQPRRSNRRITTRNALLTGLTIAALAAFLLYYSHRLRSNMPQPTVSLAVTNVGEKYSPSLSPNGQQLAFAWNGGVGPYFSIYVKFVGTEEPQRLTKRASVDFNPVWSPDGRRIAFCRIKEGETGIYIVPAIGGAERRIRDTHWEEREFYEPFWYFGRISWSPDGKSLAFSDRPFSNEPTSIFLLSLDTLAARRLTSPQLPGDHNPAFSPDGRTLAFNRGSQGVTSVYTIDIAGGAEKRLISGAQYGWGLAWTADGRDIVFAKASWLASAGWLWKISRHGGGEPERLQFGQEGTEPSIRGNQLVYARQAANLGIWRRSLDSWHSSRPADRFIASTTIESGPQFSPDGGRIAFESTRSGAYEIWMCRSDGSDLIQLTHFNSVTGTPRWSPDGRQIVFDSRSPGNADIFVMDSVGSSLRRLTNEPSTDVVPSWSRDGGWIYFASDRNGSWEVWKMPSTGGPAVRVTNHGGYAAFESPDGKFLYYAKGPTAPGLWRIPTRGGEETEVISSLEAGYWGYWVVVKDGIYYLNTIAKPGVDFFNLTTHRTTRVFDLENRPAREAPGLTVSPDGGVILYTQLDRLSRDIISVENFQ